MNNLCCGPTQAAVEERAGGFRCGIPRAIEADVRAWFSAAVSCEPRLTLRHLKHWISDQRAERVPAIQKAQSLLTSCSAVQTPARFVLMT
ncbi:unnamed protein product [Boreogadus saida]